MSFLKSNQTLESNFGVMGLFYILVAEASLKVNDLVQFGFGVRLTAYILPLCSESGFVVIIFYINFLDLVRRFRKNFGSAIFAVVVVNYQRRKHNEEGYQSTAS
ncbi:hypothetical protein Tco_0554743 [Tanacetum coccineum]